MKGLPSTKPSNPDHFSEKSLQEGVEYLEGRRLAPGWRIKNGTTVRCFPDGSPLKNRVPAVGRKITVVDCFGQTRPATITERVGPTRLKMMAKDDIVEFRTYSLEWDEADQEWLCSCTNAVNPDILKATVSFPGE